MEKHKLISVDFKNIYLQKKNSKHGLMMGCMRLGPTISEIWHEMEKMGGIVVPWLISLVRFIKT